MVGSEGRSEAKGIPSSAMRLWIPLLVTRTRTRVYRIASC